MKPRSLPGIALGFVLFAVLFIAALNTIVPARGNKFDFYPRYIGTQAFWRGETPYSEAITAQIQLGMFGDSLPPTADQQRFAYPAYTAVLMVPFALLPANVSTSLWMALQIVALAWFGTTWLANQSGKSMPLVNIRSSAPLQRDSRS